MTVPVLRLDLPMYLLYCVIPGILLLLWLQFGFLLNGLIDMRLRAFQALGIVEPELEDTVYSANELFFDSELIDLWWAAFLQGKYSVFDHEAPVSVGVLVILVYGVLVGLSHASTLSVIFAGVKKYSHKARLLCWLAPWIGLGVLVGTHILFAYGGRNPNWAQYFMGFFGVVFTYVFVWLSLRRHQSGTPGWGSL